MINNSNIKQHGSYPEFEQKAIYTFSGNVVEPTEIMTISQSSLTIEKGETATLSASVQDDPNRAIVWSSSDATVATVEDGVVTAIKAGETTITASGGKVSATCAVTVESKIPAVDLGLPSGLLWCKQNIGAQSEEEYGAYFSWGNVTGHYSTNGSTFDDSYDWGNSNSGPYASTPGASIQFTSDTKNADYSADSGYDAAHELLGGSWRMPTATEFQELYDNTDREWTSINGIWGAKFMKKSDHSVYVFFPAAGYGFGTSVRKGGETAGYLSSSLNSGDKCYQFYNTVSVFTPNSATNRYIGGSIRAVQ